MDMGLKLVCLYMVDKVFPLGHVVKISKLRNFGDEWQFSADMFISQGNRAPSCYRNSPFQDICLVRRQLYKRDGVSMYVDLTYHPEQVPTKFIAWRIRTQVQHPLLMQAKTNSHAHGFPRGIPKIDRFR